jgi:hypothetical protein
MTVTLPGAYGKPGGPIGRLGHDAMLSVTRALAVFPGIA